MIDMLRIGSNAPHPHPLKISLAVRARRKLLPQNIQIVAKIQRPVLHILIIQCLERKGET